MNGIKNLYKWSKKYIIMAMGILVFNFILQYLYSYLPIFIQFVFKELKQESNKSVNLPKWLLNMFEKQSNILHMILFVGLSMILLQALRSVMRFINNYMQGRLTQNIARDMRIKMYKHIGDLSYSYHNSVDTGDLIQRCTSDIETSSGFVSGQFPELINIFATISIGAYQVYKIAPQLMWVSLLLVPFSGIASIFFSIYVNKDFKRIEEAESKMTTCIQENVNSARVVRAFSNELFEFEKMDKANKDFTQKDMHLGNVMSFYWGASDMMVMLQYIATLSVSIYLAKSGIVDSGDIIACLLLMGMLVWPVRGLGRIITNLGKTIVAVNRLEEVLQNDSEYSINGQLKPNIEGKSEFKDVSFKFDDDDKHLLNNLSFSVNKGETIAFVGRTGSGKSTIVNIITRLLEYSSGEVLLDGINIKDIDKKHLRRNIKMVLQDPFLFSKTVYDNIAITNLKIDENKVYDAAKIAHIDGDINKFEKGYKTLVGEKGTTLSGGQKQRVAIARILVENSPVIIFDDSLSALDSKTDLLIRRALKEKNKNQTMIIITHRTTTAKEADKIIVLDKGSVESIGTHEELAQKEGLYKELWAIQGKLEEEFLKVMNGGE